MFYDEEKKSLIDINSSDEIINATFIFPDGVESIQARVFYSEPLERIRIPATVQTIGLEVFRACKRLKKVEFLHTNHPIALCDSVFMDCTQLSSINLPQQLQSIASQLFFNCKRLNQLVIPHLVTTICQLAFYQSGLIRIDLPKDILNIAPDAFDKCDQLRFIAIDTEDAEQINRIKALLPVSLRGLVCTKQFADEHYDPEPYSNFCFNAFIALAAMGGLALCISALFVASFPLSLALSLTGGAIAVGAGIGFFQHHDQVAANGENYLPLNHSPVR